MNRILVRADLACPNGHVVATTDHVLAEDVTVPVTIERCPTCGALPTELTTFVFQPKSERWSVLCRAKIEVTCGT